MSVCVSFTVFSAMNVFRRKVFSPVDDIKHPAVVSPQDRDVRAHTSEASSSSSLNADDFCHRVREEEVVRSLTCAVLVIVLSSSGALHFQLYTCWKSLSLTSWQARHHLQSLDAKFKKLEDFHLSGS